MNELTEQARKDVETLDRLFAQSWEHIAQIARVRYLLTGEPPAFPDWMKDDEALHRSEIPG